MPRTTTEGPLSLEEWQGRVLRELAGDDGPDHIPAWEAGMPPEQYALLLRDDLEEQEEDDDPDDYDDDDDLADEEEDDEDDEDDEPDDGLDEFRVVWSDDEKN